MANQELLHQIKAVHADSDATYGSPRVYQELKAQGLACSENRVARLMRHAGITATTARHHKGTTKVDASHPVAPNRLARAFQAERPNEKWLADITSIPTREGWLYLATVLDLFSRRIVGWAMADHIASQLAQDALHMALLQRHPGADLLHHSDRGSQYTGQPYQTLLQRHQLRLSLSATDSCFDNAPMESFFGTLKRELVHHRDYQTRQEARTDIFCYLEAFYNRRRRHSALDYLCPVEFERRYQPHTTLTLCPHN